MKIKEKQDSVIISPIPILEHLVWVSFLALLFGLIIFVGILGIINGLLRAEITQIFWLSLISIPSAIFLILIMIKILYWYYPKIKIEQYSRNINIKGGGFPSGVWYTFREIAGILLSISEWEEKRLHEIILNF